MARGKENALMAAGLLILAAAPTLHAQSRAASDAFLVVAEDSIPLSPSHSVTFSHGELLNADYRQVHDTVEVSVDEEVRLVFSVPVDRVEVRGGQVDEEFGAPPYVLESGTELEEIHWLRVCAFWGRDEEKCWQVALEWIVRWDPRDYGAWLGWVQGRDHPSDPAMTLRLPVLLCMRSAGRATREGGCARAS